ncbi:MAG: dihydropteroate synthase [Actinomycetota bacterium]|nr:dihydropteroate synthase [Actinomycetota bacterium]
MKFKIRALNIKNREEGLKEYSKMGASPDGSNLMIDKIFPVSLKIRGVNPLAANILKQEMLARGGDVVTSWDTIKGNSKKTDVIVQGTNKGIENLIEKISTQPFGLKELSGNLKTYMDKMEKKSKNNLLEIGTRKFNLDKKVIVMGVLNVTPDSFYDGGFYFEKEKAYKRVENIVGEGADIIDVGGMSTRPGSKPVNPEEEMDRIIPVIQHVKKNYNILISADTSKPMVAEKAIEEGAHIINDVSGLSAGRDMADVIAKRDVSIIIMHIKGAPENMQKNPQYDNVIDEIYDFLEDKTAKALECGISPGKIIIDPGIGFGKTLEHNLEILNKIKEFTMLGYPVMIGASRKSFIGSILDLPVDERLEGSIAAAVYSIMNGVSILRVHDVKETMRAIEVAGRITGGF